MNIALFGPPGSGKGTQAALLHRKFDLVHLSTGDLLRAEQNDGSALGKRVADFMRQGNLVPDEIVSELVQKSVQESFDGGRGVLFDGYPRNRRQLQRLEDLLTVLRSQVDLFIGLEIDAKRVIERITNRRTCKNCKRVYNLITHPPKTEGKCDDCGEDLFQRPDDTVEAIETRFEEYRKQTEPLMQLLEGRAVLQKVSADQPIEAIQDQLQALIERKIADLEAT